MLPTTERMVWQGGGQRDMAGEGPVDWAVKDGFLNSDGAMISLGFENSRWIRDEQ